MDVLDIFLRVCLWGSIVLLVILLFWALFGGWLSGSGKRSRPKPQPTRRQGFVPPPPSYARPGPEDSSSAADREAASPQPEAPKRLGDPKPEPMRRRGLIPPPPSYARPGPEDSSSTASGEAASPQPEAPKRPGDPKPEPMRRRGLIPPPPTYGKPRREDSSTAMGGEAVPPQPEASKRLGDPTAQMEFISKVDFKPRPLLNRSEYKILRILEEVSQDIPGGHRVMAQISLGEVLAPQMASGSKAARDLAFRSINSKRLDFLVIDGYGMPVLAVEYQGHGHYNDRTFMHDAVKREAVRKAGIRFLEIPAEYDAKDLENEIRKALLSNPARRP